ncbi:MAG: TetR/AcrR family transcriptional regulator [Parvibaculaceae bacterium]
MSGLRLRKKADRNRRIQEAAAELFRRDGYEATRMEDIAARADLGIGTLYNYYRTKGDLLLAVVTLEVENVLEKAHVELSAPLPDATAAIERLIVAYFDYSLVYLTKSIWRTAIALSIHQPMTPFGLRYAELDQRLAQQVAWLLRSLQRARLIGAEVDIPAVSDLIFNNINMMFIEFLKDDDMTIETAKAKVSRQSAPIAAFLLATSKTAGG